MSFINVLSKLFGNKSQRDLKAIMPIVEKIKAKGPELQQLTVDQLRGRIDAVRADLDNATHADYDEIARLKVEIESLPYDQRQPLWDKIDKHEKNILDTLEDKLNEHLPEVFATKLYGKPPGWPAATP